MSLPKTLLELVGVSLEPARVRDSALLLIDCQKTYTQGPMKLSGVSAALDEAKRLLGRARAAEIPIIHIVHDMGPGTLYDVQGESGAIVDELVPKASEPTIIKAYPNAFANTDLHDQLQALGVQSLIVAGFMTHCCVNSTVRAGSELGIRQTVVGSATATRDLPATGGNVIEAAALQIASLASLTDLFASVVAEVDDLPD